MTVPPSTSTLPRMAVLLADGVEPELDDPEGPVGAERPVRLKGPDSDELVAGPVRPKLDEPDAAVVKPELPDVASGMADRIDAPPVPPPAAAEPTLEPPAAARPPGDRRARRFRIPPPPPATGTAAPAGPPEPPDEKAVMPLAAVPVVPERATALEPAPLLAAESAPPAASAAPVPPELPVPPVVTAPPTAVAEPRIAELVAVGDEVAPPLPPVVPELPDCATGCAAAVEAAGPVSPVFVLPDCALAPPEEPDVAVGLMVTVDAPPLPPFAVPVATPLPPVPETIWAPAGRTAPITAAAASAKAKATSDLRRAVADSAAALEDIVTFTSFAAMGKFRLAHPTNRPAVWRREAATGRRRVGDLRGRWTMRYKLLGRTGLRVSELALGTMTFGPDWGWGADKDESRAMFDAFAEAGGNFIDTANRYTNGTAESFVGQFVGADRERFVIATKYTLSRDSQEPNGAGNHRKSLVESLDASLRRLATDYIDIYWAHIWDPCTPIDEMMRALDDQVRAGKILYIGISDAPAWVISRAVTMAELRGWTPFSAIQSQYSLVERNAERELLPMTRNLDLAFTAWGALGTGVLTGKYNKDPKGDGGRLAQWGGLDERKLAIAREVATVAEELGVSASQVALSWVRQQSPTMIPVIGARKVSQLKDNLGCLDVTLSAEQLERLDAVSRIERGFPYDFITGGRPSFMGEISARVDDHRHTVV